MSNTYTYTKNRVFFFFSKSVRICSILLLLIFCTSLTASNETLVKERIVSLEVIIDEELHDSYGKYNPVNRLVQVNSCANKGGDADRDGICASDDCNDNNPSIGRGLVSGTPCNDGDPNTILDRIQANGCDCKGVSLSICANRGGDADGDGFCASIDCDDNNPNIKPKLPGTPCNDNNPFTLHDVIQKNGCDCRGLVNLACVTKGGDADRDGICAEDDCDDNDPDFPKRPGTPCDDGKANTINDVIQKDGCDCKGEPICASKGGDADKDGICATDDCNDANASIGRRQVAGTPCDDGNPNTTNDFIQLNGCDCRGVSLVSCTSKGGDADNDGVCATDDCNDNDASIYPNAVCDDGNPRTVDDKYDENCNCTGTPLTCVDIDNQDFESSWGIWNDGGSDASRNSDYARYANSGTHCIRLRDNTSSSRITTDNLDLSSYSQVTINFSYIVDDFEDKENFWLQISTNDGSSFTTVEKWERKVDFQNGQRQHPSVTVNGPFSKKTKFRFRCDASSDNDEVYLDDITISACSRNLCGSFVDRDRDGVCSDVDCNDANANIGRKQTPGTPCNDGNPNTTNDVIQVNGCDCIGTPLTCVDIDNQDFESSWGIWNDGGSDASRNSDYASYANSGTHCIRLRDNTSSSRITTDNLDLSSYSQVTINFSYIVDDFEDKEDFWLQISTNDGSSFTTVEKWERKVDFQNGQRHNPSVTVNGPFSKKTKFRFRCDASSDNDEVYLDDIVIETCSSNPCGAFVDSDGDGVCSDVDCNDANASIGRKQTPGAPCDDGDSNTTNDVIQAGGCDCRGVNVSSVCTSKGGDADRDGICAADDCNDTNANVGRKQTPGTPCNDGDSNTTNDVIQAGGCDCRGVNVSSACTSKGGDADRDGICAADDCNDANANVGRKQTPGTPCDDGNPNTINDFIQLNGCDCRGVNVSSVCTSKGGDADRDGICAADDCNDANANVGRKQTPGTPCDDGNPNTINDFIQLNGCDCRGVNVSSVCTSKGGDADRDGICAADDCNDANANVGRKQTPGTPCDDGNSNTTNDVIQANGCDCRGVNSNSNNIVTESCGSNTSIIYGQGAISMRVNDSREYFFQVLDPSWRQVFNCGWQCGNTQSASGLSNGEYRVVIKNTNEEIVCEKVITLSNDNQSGNTDNDRDGVPNSQDCNDNDANLTTVGAACNDGNVNTENDVVQANCTCVGTATNTGNGGNGGNTESCGENTITYGKGTITIEGISGKEYFFKINDLNQGWAQVSGCSWNCGAQHSATELPNSKYLVTIYNDDWSQHCSVEIEMKDSAYSGSAGSRKTSQLSFAAYQASQEVELQWLTNSGYKVNNFEVERSTDGNNFSSIAQFVNKEWSDVMEYHHTVDKQPTEGINYYRVKEIYLDGSFAYTDIQSVGFYLDLKAFSMYPNPTQEDLNFTLSPFMDKAVNISIVNHLGQTVKNVKVDKVKNEHFKLSLGNIPSGFYQVLIQVDGHKSINKKLIVERLY